MCILAALMCRGHLKQLKQPRWLCTRRRPERTKRRSARYSPRPVGIAVGRYVEDALEQARRSLRGIRRALKPSRFLLDGGRFRWG